MAVAWSCRKCNRSVDLVEGNKLVEHNKPNSDELCEGSGTRIPELASPR